MITLRSISKKIGKNWVLRNINIRIKQGDFLVIAGENGSGKSVLFHIIAGLISPSKGEIKYLKPLKKSIVFQENLFPEFFTPTQALNFYGKLTKTTFDINRALRIVGTKTNKPLYKLSPGLKRRVELARIFITERDLIMIDEPFNYVDPKSRLRIMRELLNLNKTLIIVSNDLNLIKKSKTLLVLSKGRQIFYDSSKRFNIHSFKQLKKYSKK